MLASRQDWDIPSTQRLQLHVHSVVWRRHRARRGFPPDGPRDLVRRAAPGPARRALRAPEADRAEQGLAAAALAVVTRRLADTHGHDPRARAWGRIHPLWLHHPLGQRRPLDRIFDRGPLPGRGDPDTVAQYTIVTPAPGKAVIPSARIVIDLGD